MYCRMQFDIGREERLWETLRHEAEIAAFRSKLEAQEVMLNHLVAQRQQCMTKVEEHDGATSICGADKPSCDETTLSALLDEGEEAMDAMRLRVEELEEEKAVLAKQLEQFLRFDLERWRGGGQLAGVLLRLLGEQNLPAHQPGSLLSSDRSVSMP
jgi:hypothetical protein